MACDFCGKTSAELCPVSDVFRRYLPVRYVSLCPTCEAKINKFRRDEQTKVEVAHSEASAAAWRATAAFAVGLND